MLTYLMIVFIKKEATIINMTISFSGCWWRLTTSVAVNTGVCVYKFASKKSPHQCIVFYCFLLLTKTNSRKAHIFSHTYPSSFASVLFWLSICLSFCQATRVWRCFRPEFSSFGL